MLKLFHIKAISAADDKAIVRALNVIYYFLISIVFLKHNLALLCLAINDIKFVDETSRADVIIHLHRPKQDPFLG